jgi:hypothetical protein
MPAQKDRLQEAYDQLQYSKALFDAYPTKTKDGRYRSGSTRRTSPIFRRVVEVLTSNLYKSSPTRKLRDPADTEWLNQTYKYSRMGAKWKRADQLTLIGGFACFQYQGTKDPKNPIKINLWSADQVAFWVDEDDPLLVEAIGLIDKVDNSRRVRLYTKEELITYVSTKQYGETATRDMVFQEVNGSRRPNPYRSLPNEDFPEGEGILPFSFAHWEVPTEEFSCASHAAGLGKTMKAVNEHVNERFDRMGDAIFYLGRPIGYAIGTDPTWTPSTEIKPGDFMIIPAAEVDAGGTGVAPQVGWLQVDHGYVASDWMDLNFFIDHNLEMSNVPPVLIRMIQSSARSGESIKAEQTPLIQWVEGRRNQWQEYEEDAAKKAVEVCGAHLRANGVNASQFERLLDDWSFTLHWPNLYTITPGPERDLSDDHRVKNGYASKLTIIQEHHEMSEQEALELLMKVQEQNDLIASLGADPEIAPDQPMAPMGGDEAFDADQDGDTSEE